LKGNQTGVGGQHPHQEPSVQTDTEFGTL